MAFANKVISDQTSGIQLRLSEAFQKLDQSITQTNSAMFKEALLVFLMNVRAVLRTQ
jgi:hypothetical protein